MRKVWFEKEECTRRPQQQLEMWGVKKKKEMNGAQKCALFGQRAEPSQPAESRPPHQSPSKTLSSSQEAGAKRYPRSPTAIGARPYGICDSYCSNGKYVGALLASVKVPGRCGILARHILIQQHLEGLLELHQINELHTYEDPTRL